MKQLFNSFMYIILLCSFDTGDKPVSEYVKLEKYERLALQSNKAGKEYIVDLTGVQGCNRTRVKYLGLVSTRQGRKYKLLISFFVFKTGKDMCHGTSSIKVYDIRNRFVGRYSVGMPDDLPDRLIANKLVYSRPLQSCPLRKGTTINLVNGLPKKIFIPCSKGGGDEYLFAD